ncbi:MAG: TolC family protein [Abditibacteriota bacterium]|nr:TolC family protein [Abditibacteriota bacterium]
MRKLFLLLILLLFTVYAYCQGEDSNPKRILSLSDCISMAIDNNSDLKAARNRIITSKAATEMAVSDYFPSLSARNNTFEMDMHGDSTMIKSTTLSANLKLFDTGLRYLTVQGAKKDEKQTINSVFRTYQDVLYRVTVDYYNCQHYKELIDLKQTSLQYYTDEEKEYQEKIDLGELAPVDIYPIQSSVANAKVTLLSAENQYEDAKRDLINLLGIPDTEELDFAEESVDIEEANLTKEEYVKLALDNRTDLKAYDLAIDSAKISKKKADMDLWPLFYVNAEYGKKFNDEYVTGHNTDGRIMGYISWNIFDGFSTQAKIKQSKANLENAIENRAELERDIITSLKKLYYDITISKEQLDASKIGFESASKNRDVQREKFNLNMNTNLDILNAQVQYDTALSNLIDSKYNLKLAYIELDYQTGMLGLEDERINLANEKKVEEVYGKGSSALNNLKIGDSVDKSVAEREKDKDSLDK